MDRWKQKRISSQSKKAKKLLTDANHMWNYQDRLLEIYRAPVVSFTEIPSPLEVENSIISWYDEAGTKRDRKGRPLDIIIHKSKDIVIWEPYVEYFLKKDIIKNHPTLTIRFGYIEGRISHLDPFKTGQMMSANDNSCYILWIDINKK